VFLLQKEEISKGAVILNQDLSLLNGLVWFGEILPFLLQLLPDASWVKWGETGCGATPGCPAIVAGGTLGQLVALGFEEGVFLCLIFEDLELLGFNVNGFSSHWRPQDTSRSIKSIHLVQTQAGRQH